MPVRAQGRTIRGSKHDAAAVVRDVIDLEMQSRARLGYLVIVMAPWRDQGAG